MKQTDRLGTFSFSPIRKVFINNPAAMSISCFPNPVTDKKFIIDIGNNSLKNLTFILANAEGKVVERKTFVAVERRILIELNKNHTPGVYTVQLYNSEFRAQQNLMIQ